MSYSPARCKNSCKSFEAIEVEVTWEVYDVKIIIEDNKPTPLVSFFSISKAKTIKGRHLFLIAPRVFIPNFLQVWDPKYCEFLMTRTIRLTNNSYQWLFTQANLLGL